MNQRYPSPHNASTRVARPSGVLLRITPVLAMLAGTSPLTAQESGVQATVHGLILMNAFHTTANVNNSDVPQFAIPVTSPGNPRPSATGATVRQSRATVDAVVDDFAGGGLRGELDVDFFGGQQPSTGGRTFPLLRIRRAFAEITWRRFALLAGQEAPPIAPVSPSSLATIGLPGFAAAGNLWLWLPQIRLSANLFPMGDGGGVGLEVTALAPTSGEAQGTFLTQPDIAERSGRPYLQSRIKARWGIGQDQGEVSFGGHYGWLVAGNGQLVASRALAASVLTPLLPGLELRGEAFIGQALAGLGGGGIGQNLGANGTPVRTKGGWAQLNVRPSPAWELGGGAGIDDPDDGDLDPAGRLRNLVFEGHITWRHAPAVLGLEVRELRTRYQTPVDTRAATHVNLGVGFEF